MEYRAILPKIVTNCYGIFSILVYWTHFHRTTYFVCVNPYPSNIEFYHFNLRVEA